MPLDRTCPFITSKGDNLPEEFILNEETIGEFVVAKENGLNHNSGDTNASDELRRHRLNTLAIVNTIVELSSPTHRNHIAYVIGLQLRVTAVADAESSVDERGCFIVRRVLANTLANWSGRDADQALLLGPDVRLQPRSGQLFALAVHELAINASEFGALDVGAGQVEVKWEVIQVDALPWLKLIWKEKGLTGISKPSQNGSGARLLTHILSSELDGTVTLVFEPGGICCTMMFPLPGQVDR